MNQLQRREFVRLGIASGIAGLLAGCSSGQKSASLPGPSWPAPKPTARTPEPVRSSPTVSGPAAPAASGVVARSQWTKASPIAALADPMGRINRITVHHDGMTPFYSVAMGDAAGRLESIRRSHVNKGWADIGYHYIIDPAGRVWQGRPISLQGAHVKDENPGNIGIMVMGNFDSQSPTPAALTTLDQFIAFQLRQYSLPVRRVYTHQELKPTACPGRSLQAYMARTRATTGRMARA